MTRLILVALIAVVGFAGVASGQVVQQSATADSLKLPSTSRRPADTLFAGITLTPTQETRVKALRTAYMLKAKARLDSAYKAGVMKKGDQIPDMRDLHRAHFKELRAVLDTTQRKTFDANTAAITENVPTLKRLPNPRAPRGMEIKSPPPKQPNQGTQPSTPMTPITPSTTPTPRS